MKPEIHSTLVDEASQWEDLHRWERKQLGIALRRLGLTCSEIQSIIPVPSSTQSNWSRDVTLSRDQIEAIRERTDAHTFRGVPRDTQWRRQVETEIIRRRAVLFAVSRLNDSRFAGRVALYWGEGSKTRNFLDLTNTDPAALRYFINWVRDYMDPAAEFNLGLHLHEGNDEAAAKQYWSNALNMDSPHFGTTYIKPAGNGHRKNQLPHVVCRVRTLRASDYWHHVMVWIEVVAESFGR